MGEVVAVRVDELLRFLQRAADADRHERVGRPPAAVVLPDGAGHAEVAGAVRHFRYLGADPAGREEGGVNVPPRARSAEAGEADPGAGEALGDVARDVHPDEVEGDAVRSRLAQRGEALADLLEADVETV